MKTARLLAAALFAALPFGGCADSIYGNADYQYDDALWAKEACGSTKCGTRHGASCGTCPSRQYCNDSCINGSSTCDDVDRFNDCVDACVSYETCGEEHGVSCGTCPTGQYCNGNECHDQACAGMTCGTDNGVTCGTCTSSQYCDTPANQCKEACAGMTCGTDHGVTCGTCVAGKGCSAAHDACIGPPAGMVAVPGGTLTLGATDQGNNPPRSVTMPDFFMDITEVTVSAFGGCVTANKCSSVNLTGTACNWGVSGKDNHPINCVTWKDATDFCTWAGKRLPTEDEWEYSARYDDGRDYPWGNNSPSASLANYGSSGTGPVGTHAAGASKLGLQDLAGNVYEWTGSLGCDSPPCSSGYGRVLRGGCWYYSGTFLRAANRNFESESNWENYVGFRCARTP